MARRCLVVNLHSMKLLLVTALKTSDPMAASGSSDQLLTPTYVLIQLQIHWSEVFTIVESLTLISTFAGALFIINILLIDTER